MKTKRNLALAILTFAFIPVFSLPVCAETVLEKVARTGVLTAGTRTDAIPLAYINEKDEWLGYSIEMLVLIRDQLEKQLNQEIVLELVEVNPENRIPKLVDGEVDIVCDTSSFSWNREEYIDFSISYFVTGTRILVNQGSNLGSLESLANKRIGTIQNTINGQVIKLTQPNTNLVYFQNSEEALSALKQGEIDGFAWDGVLLEGLKVKTDNSSAFTIVPEEPYTKEGIACMMNENDSSFRDLVNYTLVKFMQGYIQEETPYVEIFDRWFGEKGIIPINRELVVDFFQKTIDVHEQISITEENP